MLSLIRHPGDFPTEFLEAYQAKRLVFFCGAGVSNYPWVPDYYGSFEALCVYLLNYFCPSWQLVEGEFKRLFDQCNYELLLDRLDLEYGSSQLRAFIKQSLTHTVMNRPHHETLLKLAHNTSQSIITTNFDPLFENPTSHPLHLTPVYLPERLESYNLQKFLTGKLVYLHGGVSSTENELVYTETHFTNAYIKVINDAWATQFLLQCMQRYHLCFVGYSVNDPLVSRLMPVFKANEPFAMVTQNASESMQRKGITPLSFEKYDIMWNVLTTWSELPV
ncbi:MAG: SIR2 family protein [Vampirovibrionales bacterium]